jgi:hypothetical protein
MEAADLRRKKKFNAVQPIANVLASTHQIATNTTLNAQKAMKTISTLSLAITLFAATASMAQTTADSTKTTKRTTTDSTKTIKTITIETRSDKFVKSVSKDFGLYIGFNNWNGSAPMNYDLRTGGSRFVALSWRRNILLARGDKARLRLGIGPEIAWNNFMFEDNNVLTERNNVLQVEPSTQALRKSKLVVAQLNVPVLLNVRWSSGVWFGAGAYIGTRIGSYTSVKPEAQDRNQDRAIRDHGSYNLSPIRWGLTGEIGWRKNSAFFFRYEPSPLFRAGQGPELNVWSAGIRL